MNDHRKIPTIDRRTLLKAGIASVTLLPTEVGMAMAAAREKTAPIFTVGHYKPTQIDSRPSGSTF